MIGLNEFAKFKGVTLRAVQKAIEAGRISHQVVKGQRKLFTFEQADTEWEANTQHSRKRIATRGQKARGITTASQVMDEAGREPPRIIPKGAAELKKTSNKKIVAKKVETQIEASAPTQQGAGLQYSQVRAMREGYDAKLKKLDFEKKSGLLVDIEKVKMILFAVGKGISENMLNITPRLASNLAACDNEFEITQMLDLEIRRALERVSNGQFEI